MTITRNGLSSILASHGKWLRDEDGGACANLIGANLISANLSSANLSSANLIGASLSSANLSSANLSSANLYGANLSGANLSGANLSGANLSGANLISANLIGASLSGAIGVTLEISSPLAMLKWQSGTIRAFKIINNQDEGIHRGGVKYVIDQSVIEPNANISPTEHCAAGINVASLDWCLKEYRTGHKIIVVEFCAEDISSIPIGTDGKLRLFRCKVLFQIPTDDINRMRGRAWHDDRSQWNADYAIDGSGDALDWRNTNSRN